MGTIRQQRTAERIKVILSELFLRELDDPRFGGVTVTRVMVDRELQVAHIYVNALGDESREREVMAALRRAGSFLRRELSQRLDVRSVPQLIFHWDPTLAHAEEVNAILDNLYIPPEDESIGNDEKE